MNQKLVQELAHRLHEATVNRTLASSEGADLLDADSAAEVAETGRKLAVASGEVVSGYKIGLTSRPAQAAFGAVEPAIGYLRQSTIHHSGAEVDLTGCPNPLVEVEIAFVLASALDSPQVTRSDVLAATKYVAPALEIVDSRWDGGPKGAAMLIADNTNAVAAVIGEPASPAADLASLASSLHLGSRQIAGTADAVMGNPADSVAWLAEKLAKAGTPLQEGDIILSGTFSAPTPLDGAREASAEIEHVGTVRVIVK